MSSWNPFMRWRLTQLTWLMSITWSRFYIHPNMYSTGEYKRIEVIRIWIPINCWADTMHFIAWTMVLQQKCSVSDWKHSGLLWPAECLKLLHGVYVSNKFDGITYVEQFKLYESYRSSTMIAVTCIRLVLGRNRCPCAHNTHYSPSCPGSVCPAVLVESPAKCWLSTHAHDALAASMICHIFSHSSPSGRLTLHSTKLCTKFKIIRKKNIFGTKVTSEAFLSISQNLNVTRLQGCTQTKLWTCWQNFDLSRSFKRFLGSFLALLCSSRWSDQTRCEIECVAFKTSFQTRPMWAL